MTGVRLRYREWRARRAERAIVRDPVDFRWLMGAAALTLVILQFPFGNLALYPFTLLGTWFHEMSHGLMALALGGQFQRLEIFADGSGLAHYQYHKLLGGAVGEAMVAAAGPLGPPVAGAMLILSSTRRRNARLALVVLGIALLVTTGIWIRSAAGLVACPAVALGILWIRFRARPAVQAFLVQLLGVQACLATFENIAYVFTNQAVIAGKPMLSDSAAIAKDVGMVYWFWGALIALLSLALLGISLWIAYRRHARVQDSFID